MVGGEVIGLARGKENTLIHVEDKRHGHDRCSIRVIERSRRDDLPVTIQIGDQIWWQSEWAMWTPVKNQLPIGGGDQRCGIDYDIQLPRIGYSH